MLCWFEVCCGAGLNRRRGEKEGFYGAGVVRRDLHHQRGGCVRGEWLRRRQRHAVRILAPSPHSLTFTHAPHIKIRVASRARHRIYTEAERRAARTDPFQNGRNASPVTHHQLLGLVRCRAAPTAPTVLVKQHRRPTFARHCPITSSSVAVSGCSSCSK